MTAAFNLSQLANNLNTSGQLDATDGLTGAVPVANGGTGSTTAAGARANLGTNDAANITTGTISTARLGSGTANSTTFLRGDNTWATAGGTPTTDQVLSATAGLTAGAIGSYAFLCPTYSVTLNPGTTRAGSALYYSNAETYIDTGNTVYYGGSTVSGTWRLLGICIAANGAHHPSLWVRIS
jgi:hypothetical protein